MKRALLIGSLLGCVCVIGALAWLKRDNVQAATPVVQPFVVHEWGTFTSLSSSDGTFLPFYVQSQKDLPGFVYSAREGLTLVKSVFQARTSMETPVLYFYTDKPRTVSVEVNFALQDKGPPADPLSVRKNASQMTEWYPAAKNAEAQLSWPKVQLVPGAQVKLPVEQQANHYYEARDVDAVPVQVDASVKGQPVAQHEKFLFYRGVSRGVASPVRVQVKPNGQFVIANTGQERADSLVLMQVQAGKIAFIELGGLNGGNEKTVAAEFKPTSADALGDHLVNGLVKAGLYKKEAQAMVATWRKAWFGDEGTRLLYLLPTATTDRLLPLKIEPRPDIVVRVLVGRIDIVTPEVEKALDGVVARIDAAQQAIDQVIDDDAKIALRPARERAEQELVPFQKSLGRSYHPAVNASYSRMRQRVSQ